MNFRLLVLSVYLTAASFMSWSFVPRFLKLMIQLSSQVSFLLSNFFVSYFICMALFEYLPGWVGPLSKHTPYVPLVFQTNELYQLAAVAFCLLSAWVSEKDMYLSCLVEIVACNRSSYWILPFHNTVDFRFQLSTFNLFNIIFGHLCDDMDSNITKIFANNNI
jgi:hypothetical protein